MSYILDALRKSDQQRRRGAAPTLVMGQATAAAPRQPALRYYGLLALALLGAGIAIGWLRPWQPEPAAPAPEAIAANPPERGQSQPPAVRSETAPKPEPKPHAQNSLPAVQAVPAPVPAPATVPAPAAAPAPAQPRGGAGPKVGKRSASPKAAAEESKKAAAPVQEQQSGTAAADAAPAQDVISLAELPLSLQQELPPMTISVHAYSGKPGDRLVGINNRMLREGDYVAPGLKLEQITPEGMIFGYKGYSFRRGVK
jgi:general secretion pathway protein B